MSELIKNLSSYNELTDFLSEWKSANDPDVYDFTGIVHVMLAALDNIKKYAVKGEIEDLGYYMNNNQWEFFIDLGKMLENFVDEDEVE